MAGSHAARSTRLYIPVIAVVVVAIGVGSFLIAQNRSSRRTTAPVSPVVHHLAVLASTPENSATVTSTASIRVSLNEPLAPSSPMPTISPALAGTWERLSPETLVFVQSAPLQPGQSVTVTVPGGMDGVRSANGDRLAASMTTTFQVAPLDTLRVQQLLAELGYLPLSFTPSTPTTSVGVPTADEQGTFSWRWSTLPASLTSLWTPGENNVIQQGAVMAFESAHNMTTDGIAGPAVWTQLLADRSAGKVNPNPYNYVSVNQGTTESLTLYSNGAVAYQTPVNTGVEGARTGVGTFPVYLRYRVTTMSGTNPNGSKYSDPGIPWVSYFHGGDALHGFIRSGYGYPQSDGCVEMPFANAAVVWPQTPIGTLVTVSPLATS